MKMDIVAGSNNDEFYTPEYAIIPLVKYLKKGSTIWCPFDGVESNFVKVLSSVGTVINTHIKDGYDFFFTNNCGIDLNHIDYIISNLPYSKKTEVLEKLFRIGKPFAMLVGIVGLFESKKRFNMFKNNDFEIMYFNKRISYFKDYNDEKPLLNPPFSSVYICHNILPKEIVFEEVGK